MKNLAHFRACGPSILCFSAQPSGDVVKRQRDINTETKISDWVDSDASGSREALKKPCAIAPVQAGAQVLQGFWIPACAGMTTISEHP